jgi:hypothetical protein
MLTCSIHLFQKMLHQKMNINNEWMIMVPSDYNDQHVTLQLYSIDGKMVELQSLNAGSTNTISVNALAPGMYFYRIQAGKNLFTGNVVKQ